MSNRAELDWQVFEDIAQVALAACRRILSAAAEAIAARGRFRIVLAGGSTPKATYRLLAQADSEWSAWEIYIGDERCLPADHPERNSRMARQALLDHVAIPVEQFHPIPAELGPVEAARHYAQTIADALPFDMVLLGMGEDGHTASLFPGHQHPANELTLAVYKSPKPPPERVSLSAAALGDCRELLFLVTGQGKREAVTAWREGKALPISGIHPAGKGTVLVDRAAMP